MDEGAVLNGPDYFYSGTYALVIKHLQFIARYGEIDRLTEVKVARRAISGVKNQHTGNARKRQSIRIDPRAGPAAACLATATATRIGAHRHMQHCAAARRWGESDVQQQVRAAAYATTPNVVP
jgi:hypothetical protein